MESTPRNYMDTIRQTPYPPPHSPLPGPCISPSLMASPPPKSSPEEFPTNWTFPIEAYALLRPSLPSFTSSEAASVPHVISPALPKALDDEKVLVLKPPKRKRLGDFRAVYDLRGWERPESPASSSKGDSESGNSDTEDDNSDPEDEYVYTKPASSPPTDISDYSKNDSLSPKISLKTVTWREDVKIGQTPPTRRRHAIPIRAPGGELLTFDKSTKIESLTPITQVPKHLQSTRMPSSRHLLPSAITPPRLSALQSPYNTNLPEIHVQYDTIEPLVYLSREEKKRNILIRLIEMERPNSDLASARYDSILSSYGGNLSKSGIHVFVDSSNIFINFQQVLKRTRNINPAAFVRQARVSFHSFALILERCRPVAKRVLVGSSGRLERPSYMIQAERCGYEVSNLTRVEKFKTEKDFSRPKGGLGNSYGTGSGSEGNSSMLKMSEQGVDEILHLKMMESLVDYEQPSTLVLATGDAAEAEYSGGFLLMIERLMGRGWNVELVAWSAGMSLAWQSPDFIEKWGTRFKIIFLDDFAEDLVAVYKPE